MVAYRRQAPIGSQTDHSGSRLGKAQSKRGSQMDQARAGPKPPGTPTTLTQKAFSIPSKLDEVRARSKLVPTEELVEWIREDRER
jgi:hypothetical protein